MNARDRCASVECRKLLYIPNETALIVGPTIFVTACGLEKDVVVELGSKETEVYKDWF